jgi:hypothetical protein
MIDQAHYIHTKTSSSCCAVIPTFTHLGGALIVVVAVISMGEVLRAGRYVNVLLGLMVAVLPWFLDGGTWPGQVHRLLVGLVITGLALPHGPKTEHYGLWDRYVM